jgi:hypothetical protein
MLVVEVEVQQPVLLEQVAMVEVVQVVIEPMVQPVLLILVVEVVVQIPE